MCEYLVREWVGAQSICRLAILPRKLDDGGQILVEFPLGAGVYPSCTYTRTEDRFAFSHIEPSYRLDVFYSFRYLIQILWDTICDFSDFHL